MGGKAAQGRMTNNETFYEVSGTLLRELVDHLRQNRSQLREEWARRISADKLLTAMSEEEIFADNALPFIPPPTAG